MNYFVEGLQGSGKSTLVNKLSELHPDHQVYREGDYSPVELAWCAYTTEAEYKEILEKYQVIRGEIVAKSHREGDRYIICYTKIRTDVPGFYKDLEQFEIYNNRVSFERLSKIVFSRFRKWKGDSGIFECSMFQNIVEDMILFRNMTDQEILGFYEEIAEILKDRDLHIMYLETADIPANIAVIRKERSDDQGNELWFPMMMEYFNVSPYAAARGISGEEELYRHLKHRQELELRLCREVFPGKYTILKSKGYAL